MGISHQDWPLCWWPAAVSQLQAHPCFPCSWRLLTFCRQVVLERTDSGREQRRFWLSLVSVTLAALPEPSFTPLEASAVAMSLPQWSEHLFFSNLHLIPFAAHVSSVLILLSLPTPKQSFLSKMPPVWNSWVDPDSYNQLKVHSSPKSYSFRRYLIRCFARFYILRKASCEFHYVLWNNAYSSYPTLNCRVSMFATFRGQGTNARWLFYYSEMKFSISLNIQASAISTIKLYTIKQQMINVNYKWALFFP